MNGTCTFMNGRVCVMNGNFKFIKMQSNIRTIWCGENLFIVHLLFGLLRCTVRLYMHKQPAAACTHNRTPLSPPPLFSDISLLNITVLSLNINEQNYLL